MYIFFYCISCAELHSFHLSYCSFLLALLSFLLLWVYFFLQCLLFFTGTLFFPQWQSRERTLFFTLNCIQEHTIFHNSPGQCVYSAHLFIWSLPLSPNDRSSSPGHEFAGSSSPEPPSDSLGLPRYADTGPMHPANTFTVHTFSVCVPIW